MFSAPTALLNEDDHSKSNAAANFDPVESTSPETESAESTEVQKPIDFGDSKLEMYTKAPAFGLGEGAPIKPSKYFAADRYINDGINCIS